MVCVLGLGLELVSDITERVHQSNTNAVNTKFRCKQRQCCIAMAARKRLDYYCWYEDVDCSCNIKGDTQIVTM